MATGRRSGITLAWMGRCGQYGVCEEASRNARILNARVEEGSGSVLRWRVCSVRMPSRYQSYSSTQTRRDTIVGRHVDAEPI